MENMVAGNWISIVFGALGVINLYVAFGLSRKAKKQDEHEAEHASLCRRISALEQGTLKESRFREIIREEIMALELRLMKEGRLNDPR